MKKKIFKYAVFMCIFIFSSNILFAQFDDPNLDQIPQEYLDYISTVSPKAPAVVTDNSGYDNFDMGIAFAEVHTVMNPRNPLQSMAAWNTTAGSNLYYTLNGLDWTLSPQPAWGQAMRGDPVLAYDSLGNGFFDNMYGATILGTRTARTSNNGQSWNSVVNGNIGVDKNWIAADQTGGPYANYIYGVMTPGNFVRSTDNGASFAVTYNSTNQLPGMMVCVGPNGNISGGSVYFVTNVGSSFAPIWTFFKSTDGGATFNLASQVNFANYVGTDVGGRNSVQNMRTRPYPFITADNSYGPHRGRLYLIYASNMPVGNGNKPDIFCRYSDDQGTTWSAETTVNDDVNSQNNNQFMPAPWCDKETGRLYIQWMDTRDCPTSDSALIYATYSDDGVTFAPNSAVSNKKFRINCSTCGGGGTPRYLGDYNGITSNSVTSLLAWTDFRNNNFANFVAYYPDYAVKTSTPDITISNGLTTTFNVSVPSVKSYSKSVKFSLSMDTLPAAGNLNLSFVGKDSVNSYPDSVKVKVDAVGPVSIGNYYIKITSKGPNGTPVHKRYVRVIVNSTSDITLLNSSLPKSYTLYQNYPNPFNPTTNIKFDIVKNGNVKVVVYNALGKAVSTLLDNTLTPGSYEVNFNAAGMASGIYYYRITTKEFSNVKKMLLIK